MSTLTAIPKIARMIPRLASDRDGEALATVRAIQRTLASDDADLCDLADWITRAAAKDSPATQLARAGRSPRTGVAPAWRTMPHAERIKWLDRLDMQPESLSEWERRFIDDLARQFTLRPFRISDAQGSVIERMIEKLWRTGVTI